MRQIKSIQDVQTKEYEIQDNWIKIFFFFRQI